MSQSVALPGDDRGMVTIEAAVALSVILLAAAGVIGALATLAAEVAATDIAGAAARAHAIGVDYRPPRGLKASVHVAPFTEQGLLVASAEVPAPFGTMSAEAVFPAEHRAQESGGPAERKAAP